MDFENDTNCMGDYESKPTSSVGKKNFPSCTISVPERVVARHRNALCLASDIASMMTITNPTDEQYQRKIEEEEGA